MKKNIGKYSPSLHLQRFTQLRTVPHAPKNRIKNKLIRPHRIDRFINRKSPLRPLEQPGAPAVPRLDPSKDHKAPMLSVPLTLIIKFRTIKGVFENTDTKSWANAFRRIGGFAAILYGFRILNVFENTAFRAQFVDLLVGGWWGHFVGIIGVALVSWGNFLYYNPSNKKKEAPVKWQDPETGQWYLAFNRARANFWVKFFASQGRALGDFQRSFAWSGIALTLGAWFIITGVTGFTILPMNIVLGIVLLVYGFHFNRSGTEWYDGFLHFNWAIKYPDIKETEKDIDRVREYRRYRHLEDKVAPNPIKETIYKMGESLSRDVILYGYFGLIIEYFMQITPLGWFLSDLSARFPWVAPIIIGFGLLPLMYAIFVGRVRPKWAWLRNLINPFGFFFNRWYERKIQNNSDDLKAEIKEMAGYFFEDVEEFRRKPDDPRRWFPIHGPTLEQPRPTPPEIPEEYEVEETPEEGVGD